MLEEEGKGVPGNPAPAKKLYEKAIQLWHNASMYNLAEMLRKGAVGIESDAVQAIDIYRRAIEHGNFKALNTIATLLLNGGKDVSGNPELATQLYE